MKKFYLYLAPTIIAACLSGCGALVPVVHSPQSPSPSSATTVPSTPPPAGNLQFIPAPQVATTAIGILDGLRPPCSVQLEMYELGNPALLTALANAHQKGCAMTIELDGTENQSLAAAIWLRARAISVKLAHINNQGIDHVKALAVDGGKEVLVGGVNWGQYSSYTNDADVLLTSDYALSQRLSADWQNLDSAFSGGNTSPSAISGNALESSMVDLINQAQSHILVITNYLTSYALQDALASAVQRKVTVDVLLNPNAYGAASAASWLTHHGIDVRYAPASPYLHAKVILTDNSGIIGSANLSYDGLNVNRELDTIIPTPLLPAAQQWGEALWSSGKPVA